MSETPRSNCRKIAILGATSGIAEATARLLAADGCALALFGRDSDKLKMVADDLKLRGAETVSVHTMDLVTEGSKETALREAAEKLNGLDGVLLFYGVLGDQDLANDSTDQVRTILDTNFVSAAEWLTAAYARLKHASAPRPVILGISSVAGDRGRR